LVRAVEARTWGGRLGLDGARGFGGKR